MLSVTGLCVSYGEHRVLRGLSLRVERGETIVIVGDNGSGKSTLLKCLAGVLVPQRGNIELDGHEQCWGSPKRMVGRGVVLVPQRNAVFEALTVQENLMLGAVTFPGAFAKVRLRVVLEHIPTLRRIATRAAGALSGGEQRLVAIGRGLMASPRILLVDEPLVGLSQESSRQIVNSLRRLCCRKGFATIVVEHRSLLLSSLSAKIYGMKEGVLVPMTWQGG